MANGNGSYQTSSIQTYSTWTLVLSLLSCVLLILGFSWCCPMRWTLDLLTSLTQKLGRKKKNTFQFHACNQKISLKMDLGIEFQRKEREGKKSLMRVTLFFMLFKSFFLSSPIVPLKDFLYYSLCAKDLADLEDSKGFCFNTIKPNLTLPWSAKFSRRACK